MAKHGARHVRKTSVVGSMAVLVVVALVGYLVVTNLRVNKSATVSSDAAELIEHRVQRVDELQSEVNKLGSQIDDYNTLLRNNEMQSGNSEEAGQSTMLPAVTGPGVTVTLNDSSMWRSAVDSSGSTADIDKYVVHQQDVEAVVDALWAGGAESMQIMDQRVLPTSAVICSGNVLLLQGRKYSPPFTISAIGPVDGMLQSLDDSRAIQIYKQYVDAFGLGYDVEVNRSLTFQRTPLVLNPLRYAKAFESGGSNESANGGQTTSATN